MISSPPHPPKKRQVPHLIAFHTFHEEVRNPECVEEVSGPLLLLACVFLQLKKIKDIKMPRLQVDGKGPRSLAEQTEARSERASAERQRREGREGNSLFLGARNLTLLGRKQAFMDA